MRGELPNEKRNEITRKLPKIDERLFLASYPGMGQQIHDSLNESSLGISMVCLKDAGDRFNQVYSSLYEAYACLVWHREIAPDAPHQIEAVSTCKYYLDYTTLLLYATAEDISFFVIYFLDISHSLKAYLQEQRTKDILKNKRISSNAGKIGLYLRDKLRDHEISRITGNLHQNQSWRKSLDYRNTWVHSKPPIIAGLGIQHSREKTVTTLDDGTKRMYFGYEAEHAYTIEELLKIVHEASEALSIALSDLTKLVIERRESMGEVFDFENNSINLFLPVVPKPDSTEAVEPQLNSPTKIDTTSDTSSALSEEKPEGH